MRHVVIYIGNLYARMGCGEVVMSRHPTPLKPCVLPIATPFFIILPFVGFFFV